MKQRRSTDTSNEAAGRVGDFPPTRLAAPPRVTAADIARSLDLSYATVTHVLSGRAEKLRIKAETRQRVMAAAQEMGYRPHAVAKAISTGRTGTVTLVQPTRHTYLPPQLLFGLSGAAEAHDLQLTITSAGEDLNAIPGAPGGELPKAIREVAADGLLVNYIDALPAAFVAAIERHRIPAVYLNNRRAADCVHPDDVAAGALAASHLLALGHRHISYACTAPAARKAGAHYSVSDRLAGCRKALEEAGLPPPAFWEMPAAVSEFVTPAVSDERIGDAVRRLSAPDRPTAIVTYSPISALPILIAAAQCGLRVPEDLSVVTCREAPEWHSGCMITTVVTHFEVVGREALDMLLLKIASPGGLLPPRPVPPTLSVGASTGPAPPQRRG
jgi:LacI family transcriptional regulator